MKPINAINSIIKDNHRFLICTHVNPDLDALCSQLSMAIYLKSLGKKVSIINEQPLASMYAFLSGASMIRAMSNRLVRYDVVFIFDCGEISRLGKALRLIDKTKPIINIDHHRTNTFFGTCNLVNAKASSTAELLFDFFHKQRVKLTGQMAELLYLGIVSDTGSFCHENTTAHTHDVAARLLRIGLPAYQLYRKIYSRLSCEDLQILLSSALKYEIFLKGKIVFISLKSQFMIKTQERFDLKDRLFRLFLDIEKVEVVVIFTEIESNLIRINFRSTGKIDVSEVAKRFKGGGHRSASGCQFKSSIKKAKKTMRNVLEECSNIYEKCSK